MGMALADLVVDLKASLHDSAAVFKAPDDADFKRFLSQSLPDMQIKRPITRLGTVQLTPGVSKYPMPVADFASLKTHQWGDFGRAPKPWEPGYPGAVPRVVATWDGATWSVELYPFPSAVQISAFGRDLPFWYFARHVLGDLESATTVNAMDRGLLLIRAQAEAMRELSIRNAAKPVQMRDGLSGTPRNSTPAALHNDLMTTFWDAR